VREQVQRIEKGGLRLWRRGAPRLHQKLLCGYRLRLCFPSQQLPQHELQYAAIRVVERFLRSVDAHHCLKFPSALHAHRDLAAGRNFLGHLANASDLQPLLRRSTSASRHFLPARTGAEECPCQPGLSDEYVRSFPAITARTPSSRVPSPPSRATTPSRIPCRENHEWALSRHGTFSDASKIDISEPSGRWRVNPPSGLRPFCCAGEHWQRCRAP